MAAATAASSGLETAAVSQLPDHYREVVFLRDYAKADWEEIRKTLDKPSVPAAKQLHQRAWIEIRKIARPRLTQREDD